MTDESNDNLDRLLRRWHEGNAPAEAELERLRSRISETLGETRFLDVPSEPARRSLPALRAGLWFALGAAAAVLLMLSLRSGSQPPQSTTARRDQSPALPQIVQLPQSQLLEKARLLATLEETFNGQLAWVAEHGRQVQLGLLPDAAPLSGDRMQLAVRVVVLARKVGEAAWKPIWQTDAIARDEEMVDLSAENLRDGSLRLWMHRLPDGAIAMDADLAIDGPVALHSSFSGVQHAGTPQRAFYTQNDEAEYQVFQTVALLAERQGS